MMGGGLRGRIDKEREMFGEWLWTNDLGGGIFSAL